MAGGDRSGRLVTTQLVSRRESGLRARHGAPSTISSEGVTVHYGGDSPWPTSIDRSSAVRFQESCDHERCASIWRAWQAFHMDGRGWSDIAYNSGVCPHGVRFEGRGPGVRSGANGTNDGNRRSAACVYIAGGNDPLTESAKDAFADEGVRLGGGLRWQHGDWKSTACAGPSLRAWKGTGFAPPGSGHPLPQPLPVVPPRPSTVPYDGTIWRVRSPLMRGLFVGQVQTLVNAAGCRAGAVDNVYGQHTAAAVQCWQRKIHVSPDGKWGPATEAATRAALGA